MRGRGTQPSAHEPARSEEHTSELQSLRHLVCRLLLEKKRIKIISNDDSKKGNTSRTVRVFDKVQHNIPKSLKEATTTRARRSNRKLCSSQKIKINFP